MASSKKPDARPWPAQVEQVYLSIDAALRDLSGVAAGSLLVAYSGGLDSHVLLVAMHRWCQQHRRGLRAVYIDHGLQDDSVHWAAHCARVCESLNVPFTSVAVDVELGNGASPEKAARDARYAALEWQLQSGEMMLTAHHADDQAETLLLQLLRGAGVQGAAAMPSIKPFADGWHVRPMLSINRVALEAVANALQLKWVEDTSNTNQKFDRNYLRHSVMPVLQHRWPAVVSSLGRAAGHASQATALLQEIAMQDVELKSDVLDVAALQVLSTQRQANALRAWISCQGFALPSTAKLRHMMHDLIMASSDTNGRISFDQAEVCRHRQSLYIGARGSFAQAAPFDHAWAHRAYPLPIPETNQTLTANDLPLTWIADDVPLQIKSRQGGEKIRLAGQPYQQSVKSLLQQQGLPPWQRSKLPFVWHRDQLLGIIGIGFIASPAD